MHVTCLLVLALIHWSLASGSITQANGNARISFYPNAHINKSNVPRMKERVRLFLGTDEKFLAQPLIYGNIVTLISMSNTLYQLNAASGELLQKRQLAIPFNFTADLPSCAGTDYHQSAHAAQATPVIWRNTLYVLLKTYRPGTHSGLANSYYRLYALDYMTWETEPGFPVDVEGSYNGIQFDPSIHQQRTGLLVQDDFLFFAFASYCDMFSYRGWIFSIDPMTGANHCTFAPETGNGQWGAGIWQSGMGMSATDSGSFYAVTGNGFGDKNLLPTAGTNAKSFLLPNSVVRFSTATCAPVDFFAPADASTLDNEGLDLGVGALALLSPTYFGNATAKGIGVTLSKDNKLWVLNAKDLGGFQQGKSGTDKVLQVLSYAGNEARSTPSAWPVDRYVYVTGNDAPLQAFQYDPASGTFALKGQSMQHLTFNTGSAAVSSVQYESGTAAVWVSDTPFVRAFDSIPTAGGVLTPLLNIRVGSTCKFTSPTFSAGKVYIATCDGHFVMIE